MDSLDFDSRDIDEFEDLIEGLYSKTAIRPAADDMYARITRDVLTPTVSFDETDYRFDLEFDGDPGEFLLLTDVVSGTVQMDGEPGQNFGPGEMFVLIRPGLPHNGIHRHALLRHVMIDAAMLRRVSLQDDEAGTLKLPENRAVSPQAARSLRRTIREVRQNVLSTDDQHSRLAASTAAQYLAARILTTLTSDSMRSSMTGTGRDANCETLRRAISFIESNPDRDISVSDIARAAYVSPRALQLTFRRRLDTTPMAYLQRVRLEEAHDALRSATPGDGTTVSRTALDWGFTNPGRFAALHRRAFGESPNDTLRS